MNAPTFHPPSLETFDELVALRKSNAGTDHFDSNSSMESMPSVEELEKAANEAEYFRVVEIDGKTVGYTYMRQWDEASGPHVVLCDWYLTSTCDASVVGAVIDDLEKAASALGLDHETIKRSVFATNASSVEHVRADAIKAAGYQFVFTQIEMELTLPPAPRAALPVGFVMRDAKVSDAGAMLELTRRVWADRKYFTVPTTFENWLQESDLSLFNLAFDQDQLVGYVATVVIHNVAEIEDVQVHPDFQRGGIARALLAHNLSLLSKRGIEVVRLNTEESDLAGAKSLYEKFGFETVRSYLRYRKPFSQR